MGSGYTTVIVVLEVVVPPGPVAEIVYEVVTVGETEIVPDTPTGPIPGSIFTVSASVVDQESVEGVP